MTNNRSEWVARLSKVGMNLSGDTLELLQRHVDLILEANQTCSLVSQGDLADLWGRHVVDSLSLAPVIERTRGGNGVLFDIGSGGGFPAVPLRMVLPELRIVLIERSERKMGFLRRVLAALHLDEVEVVLGEFPRAVQGWDPDWVTARAVEKPEKMSRQILEALPAGAAFLCQSGQREVCGDERFHVERVEDDWSLSGLRRGNLEIIRRLT